MNQPCLFKGAGGINLYFSNTLLGRLRDRARDVGLTLNQYLEQLADGQSPSIKPPLHELPLPDLRYIFSKVNHA